LLLENTRKDAVAHADYVNRTDAIGRKLDAVQIKSGATVRSVVKGSEVHRKNGQIHLEFGHPSTNPIVRVEAPEATKYRALSAFHTRRRLNLKLLGSTDLKARNFPDSTPVFDGGECEPFTADGSWLELF
jgi:hypothetical protein